MSRRSPAWGVGLVVSSILLAAIIVLMVMVPSSVEIVEAASDVGASLLGVLTFLRGSHEKSG